MRTRRLVLVTLSGVRIHDPELLRLGLTLPGFVERSRVIASLPTLSLLVLAALTPPHWQVEMREWDGFGDADVDALAASAPDLVAISALTARILEAYAVADRLRARGIRVVLGGLHVTALPDEAIAHADAIVVGEAEEVWPGLLADCEAGRLQPRYRASTPARLEQAPIPRYDLLDPARYNRITLQTARGCPLHCDFCAASRTLGPYRLKPMERVRAELEAILAIWPRPFLELADDNTFVNKRWSRELVRLLAEYPVKWFTETDLSVADDEELLDALADARCAQLLIGLESANPGSLRGIEAADWKYRQFEGSLRRVARIQERGISVNGCFVLGFDEDDTGAFDRTLEFVRASGLAEVQITLLTPFPGTDLHRRLAREGRLLREVYWDRCTLFDVTYRPARMGVEELEQGFRRLMTEIYRPEAAAGRRRAFAGCVRRARRPGPGEPPTPERPASA